MKKFHVTEDELKKALLYIRLYGIDNVVDMLRRDAYDKKKE
jgi:hypothetical protein